MAGWLIDTNVISQLSSARPDPSVVAWAAAQDEHQLYLSVLTLAEIEHGLANLEPDHPARPRIAADLQRLELRFAQRTLSLSNAIVLRWGRLAGDVRRRTGKPPPVVDALLAATAIEHGLTLVTRNVRDIRETGVQFHCPFQG